MLVLDMARWILECSYHGIPGFKCSDCGRKLKTAYRFSDGTREVIVGGKCLENYFDKDSKNSI
jgi:hypothetical protein